MIKLSEADKKYLQLLIIDCERFDLNEIESLAYIATKLKRVSRRTYYHYKKEIMNSDFYGTFLWETPFTKGLYKLHLDTLRRRIINSSNDTRIISHNVWNDPEFITKYFHRFLSDGYAIAEQGKHLLGRFNSQQALSSRNYKLIPPGATIRKEYVKCGNPYCYRCKHGPYYYGYWKENGKLKKKYIGRYDPRKETEKVHEEIHFQ